MKKLPRRMSAISDMVGNIENLADIGCDHAYISIDLVKRNKVKKIIATDLREGPLKRARRNIKDAGFMDKIELRLCSGLSDIEPNEVDAILISGMGGILIRDILREGRDVVDTVNTLILEPQSDLRLVRAYLREIGFTIAKENMIAESGKYYQIIRAEKGEKVDKIKLFSEDEFGPYLIKTKNPVLVEFLKKRRTHFTNILHDDRFLKSQRNSEDRIKFIKRELALVNEALGLIFPS